MRLAEKERKKTLVPNSLPTRPWLENSNKKWQKILKNQKTSFQHYSYPKWDDIGQEREKRNVSPELRSSLSWARKFQKTNSNKIQKKKKTLFWHYFYRNQDDIGRE